MIEIVNAKELPETELVEHLVACFSESYSDRFSPDALEAYLSSVREVEGAELLALDDESCFTFAAVDGGSVYGSVVVSRSSRGCFVWGMYVREERQREGVGSALLQHALKTLDPKDEIYLTVLKESSDAFEFYQSHGFSLVGEDEEEVFPDAIDPVVYMSLNRQNLSQRTLS